MKDCLCAATRQAARLLTSVYESELKPSGLHPGQFELLTWIAGLPKPAQSLLAQKIGADQTTLSRNLRVLLRDGLLASEAGKSDKRMTYYRLTDQGREALRVATLGWNRAQKRMERALGSDWTKVRGAIERLTEAAAS